MRSDHGRVGRGVFPRRRWPRSRRWHASCRPSRAFRSRAGRALSSPGRRSSAGSSRRSRRSTIWRWLREDAIRPWNLPLVDLPARPEVRREGGSGPGPVRGPVEGQLLEPGDFVVCADEKPSIQARARKHPSQPATPGGEGQLVEHEYERKGALCYLAAWDARRAKLFDRCAPKDGIEPFDQLVEQFMSVEPYSRAQRVFGAHRRQRSGALLRAQPVDRPPRRRLAKPVSWRSPRRTRAGSTRPRSTFRGSEVRAQQLPDLTAEQTLLVRPPTRTPAVERVHPKTFTNYSPAEQPTPQLQLAGPTDPSRTGKTTTRRRG